MSLPVPEFCWGLIQTTRPGDQVFHTPCGKKRTVCLQPLNPNIFRISNNAFASKLRRLLWFRLEADRTNPGHRRKSATALLVPFGLIEVSDAFFGDDVAHVISVDHDWGERHSGLPAHFYSVRRLNECGNSAFCKSLQSLYDYLSAPSHGR